MKINFTKEHYAKLSELALDMLMSNSVVITRLGTPLSIVELLHTQTVSTLNNIKFNISKLIENLENLDEWSATDTQQEKLSSLKKQKELVNLIIGWKRYSEELKEIKVKKEQLSKELETLKESQKTPEDKIKELEAKLKELDSPEEF